MLLRWSLRCAVLVPAGVVGSKAECHDSHGKLGFNPTMIKVKVGDGIFTPEIFCVINLYCINCYFF